MGQTLSASAVGPNGTHYRVSFSSEHFAEGGCRYAYRGTLLSPKTMDVVVKRFKEEHRRYTQEWKITIKTSQKAQELATKFNKDLNTSRPIHFKLPFPMKLKNHNIQNPTWSTFLQQEWVVVEPYIPGDFTKWNSNSSWVNTDQIARGVNTPSAFSHWTWVASGGELIVCDIQGVRNADNYSLTDPAIHSKSRCYGITDFGEQGILKFFATHKCNDICRQMRIDSKRPQRTFTGELAANRSTVYWPAPTAGTVRQQPPPIRPPPPPQMYIPQGRRQDRRFAPYDLRLRMLQNYHGGARP